MNRSRFYRSILIVVALLIAAPMLAAAAPPTPTYATATVDGNPAEWDLVVDKYAEMHEAFKLDHPVTSYLYLRYDCHTQTLYALVEAAPGHTVKADAGQQWLKLGNQKLVDGTYGNNGTPPDFAWVGLSGDGQTAAGWEASTPLAPNVDYTNFNAHAYVDGGATSGIVGSAIEVYPKCTPTAVTVSQMSAGGTTVNWPAVALALFGGLVALIVLAIRKPLNQPVR